MTNQTNAMARDGGMASGMEKMSQEMRAQCLVQVFSKNTFVLIIEMYSRAWSVGCALHVQPNNDSRQMDSKEASVFAVWRGTEFGRLEMTFGAVL